jgi:predicted ferric reductase
MLNFDGRGDNNVLLIVLAVWLAIGVLMLCVSVFVRDVGLLHRPLIPPQKKRLEGKLQDMYEAYVPSSLGHMIVILWVAGYLVLCFLYMHEHARINNLVGKAGRGIGSVVAGLLSLILLPVSRQSLLLKTFGIPFERAVAAHRTLGFLVFWSMTAHGLAMMISYIQVYTKYGCVGTHGLWYLFRWEVVYPHGPPLAGTLAWVFTVIAVALANVRRKNWELFIVSHVFCYMNIFFWSVIHYETFLVMFGLPLILYIIDVFARMADAMAPTQLLHKEVIYNSDQGITMLKISKPGFRCDPGQYVLVKVRPLSAFVEWHPFSVSSYEGEHGPGVFTVHCKNMGKDTWTGKLRDIELSASDVQIEGPFGNLAVNISNFSTVIFIAGGIGVTPMINAIGTACKRGMFRDGVKVRFIWTVKDWMDVVPFHSALEAFPVMGPSDYACIVYATKPSGQKVEPPSSPTAKKVASDSPVQVTEKSEKALDGPVYEQQEGRPKWREILTAEGRGSDCAVLCCGPAPMVTEVQRLAYELQTPFHAETFAF